MVNRQPRDLKHPTHFFKGSLALMLTLLISASCPSFASSNSLEVNPMGPVESLFTGQWKPTALSEHDPMTATVVNLITYIRRNVKPMDPSDPDIPFYNRIRHFGGWMLREKGNCLDTRAFVLIRDSDPSKPVKMREPDGCLVVKGNWDDPYTGRPYKLASAVQVDHMVPLKNAYYSGASEWKPDRRCHYFNYMGNDFHLRTVSGHENMSKGDRSPERYMPPNEEHHCQYLKEWMKIKTIWGMTVTEEERIFIEDSITNLGCSARDVSMSSRELEEQRDKSDQPIPACIEFRTRVEKAENAAQTQEAS